jgi:hypothetical protein
VGFVEENAMRAVRSKNLYSKLRGGAGHGIIGTVEHLALDREALGVRGGRRDERREN